MLHVELTFGPSREYVSKISDLVARIVFGYGDIAPVSPPKSAKTSFQGFKGSVAQFFATGDVIIGVINLLLHWSSHNITHCLHLDYYFLINVQSFCFMISLLVLRLYFGGITSLMSRNYHANHLKTQGTHLHGTLRIGDNWEFSECTWGSRFSGHLSLALQDQSLWSRDFCNNEK